MDWESNEKRRKLREALESIYPDPTDLAIFVSDALNENLTAIASGRNLRQTVFELVEWARSKNKLDILCNKFCRENSGHPLVAELEGDRQAEATDVMSRPPASVEGYPVNISQSMTLQLFLAHANEDKPQVRQLYEQLKQKGYQPWLDEIDLIGGQFWRLEIPKVIDRSDIFIACLSQQSVQKRGYIQREYRLALNKLAEMPPGSIYLIPLKLDNCQVPDLDLPEYGLKLRDIQWIDYWKPDGLERLERAIAAAAKQKPTSTSVNPPGFSVSRRVYSEQVSEIVRRGCEQQLQSLKAEYEAVCDELSYSAMSDRPRFRMRLEFLEKEMLEVTSKLDGLL